MGNVESAPQSRWVPTESKYETDGVRSSPRPARTTIEHLKMVSHILDASDSQILENPPKRRTRVVGFCLGSRNINLIRSLAAWLCLIPSDLCSSGLFWPFNGLILCRSSSDPLPVPTRQHQFTLMHAELLRRTVGHQMALPSGADKFNLNRS